MKNRIYHTFYLLLTFFLDFIDIIELGMHHVLADALDWSQSLEHVVQTEHTKYCLFSVLCVLNWATSSDPNQ